MSTAVYRRFFKRRHDSMKAFLHSCGSLDELLPDLVEAGYEVINPVQTDARGMEPERLKREFGGDGQFPLTDRPTGCSGKEPGWDYERVEAAVRKAVLIRSHA